MATILHPERLIITDKFWGFSHQTNFAGADTGQIIDGQDLAPTKAYSDICILDGVGVTVLQNAGINYTVQVEQEVTAPNIDIQHQMWAHSGAQKLDGDSRTNLNLWLKNIQNTFVVRVNATVALNDYIYTSAWGHYAPMGLIAEPQEVTVKGVQFFPKRKVSGPV